MSKLKVSVIVPTYNEEEKIEKFLKQFRRQTLPRDFFEIIVVDGESTDRTREIAEKYAEKVIIQKSEGIAGARNDGVKVSEANIIATTDADIIVPPTWLEQIIAHFENDEDLALVFGRNIPATKKRFTVLNFLFKRWLNIIGVVLHRFYLSSGTNTAFRKKPFWDAGGYYHMFIFDDIEITSRIKNYGKIKYDDSLYIYSSVRRIKKYGISRFLLTGFSGMIKIFIYGRDYKEKDRSKEKYS